MNVKRTRAPWVQTAVTAVLLYGIANAADARNVDSAVSLSPGHAVCALSGSAANAPVTDSAMPMR